MAEKERFFEQQSTISRNPCLRYSVSSKTARWDEIDAERDRRMRELIGEELWEYLERREAHTNSLRPERVGMGVGEVGDQGRGVIRPASGPGGFGLRGFLKGGVMNVYIDRRFMVMVLRLLMYLVWRYPGDRIDVKDVEALIQEIQTN